MPLNHDTFYNRERSGYKELMSYYPNFWKEILEMRANNKFAGYTLDRAAEDMEQIIFDQYFDTCSKSMVVRYENFLGLNNSDKEWDERRTLIKIKWVGDTKMNRTRIKAIIKECYECECNVNLSDTQLIVDLYYSDDSLINMQGIKRLLNSSTIPAHIGIAYKAIIFIGCITLLEEMDVKKLRLHTVLSFFGTRLLNGSHFRDGSHHLNAERRYWLMVGISCRAGSAQNREIFSLQALAVKAEIITGLENHAGAVFHSSIDFKTAGRKGSKVVKICLCIKEPQEKMENATATTKTKDYRFLKGYKLLEGSKKLDSVYREEKL